MQVSEARWILSLEAIEPSLADEIAVREAALARLALFSPAGLVEVLAEGMLTESAAWSPTLKRTASASNETERHEVYDGGQHVGTIARSRAYSATEPDRHSAWAVNGSRVSGYAEKSRQGALDALRKHLEEAPARVVPGPAGKHLVMSPDSYGGATTYRAFSDHAAARYAAGLPPQPSSPERDSKVEAVAEALRFDLLTVAHLDIPPLRRVQEARRAHPFDLVAEDFDPNELRGFGGKWIKGGARINNLLAGRPSTSLSRRAAPADQRYEGGVTRESAKLRAAHAAKPQIALADLPGSVGSGRWDAGAKRTTADLLAGKVKDTETAHRTGPHGSYSKERQALHERIVSNLLQGKSSHKQPEAIFTAGGPASGKSSLEKHGHLVLPGDVVHANPDVVREMLPEYQQLKAAGREDAAGLTHEEASHLAKVVTRVALARQHHLLVDSVGDSGAGKFAGKINAAKAAGYKTSVHYTTIHTAEAIRRADKRGQRTGRFVDHGVITSAHQAVSQRFPEVASIPGVHVRVFDNNGAKPHLIAERKPGSDNLSIADRKAFEAFRAKAKG